MIIMVMIMIKLLAICPYEEKILKAIVKTNVADLASYTIIGSRKKIVETCYLNNICYHLLTIKDITNDFDICDAANSLLKEEHFNGILFGSIPEQFKKNIVTIDSDITLAILPLAHHLLVIPKFLNDDFVTIEDKKQAILSAIDMLKQYNISYIKIGLITGTNKTTLNIEKNVMKMDEKLKELMIDIVTVEEIFPSEYNVLVFNNNDVANIFLATISMFDKCKQGKIKKASNHYVIDANELTYINLYYSVFLLNKMRFNTKTS